MSRSLMMVLSLSRAARLSSLPRGSSGYDRNSFHFERTVIKCEHFSTYYLSTILSLFIYF